MTAPAVLPSALVAHGIGSREDLPLPLGWAVAGAATAVVLSFVLLGVLWREPRLDAAAAGHPLPAALAGVLDAPAFRRVLAGLGLALAALTLLALLFGPDGALNPVPYVVYVLVWVGLVPASVLFGPVWRQVNPVRTVHALLNRALGLDPRDGVRPLPAGLGWWPAAVGLFGFAWLELVSTDPAALSTLRIAIALYVAVQLLAGVRLRQSLVRPRRRVRGVVGPVRPDGAAGAARGRRPGAAAPADRADRHRGRAGAGRDRGGDARVDRVRRALGLDRVGRVRPVAGRLRARPSGPWACSPPCWSSPGCSWRAREPPAGWAAWGWGRPPRAFAPSLVPVALGYVVAHYYSFFVVEAQVAVIRLSDPVGTGANWLGTSHLQPSYALADGDDVADVQVLAIVVGHVLGVIVAHDRAVRLFPRRAAVVGQMPLLVLMVALTCLGLFLLFWS